MRYILTLAYNGDNYHGWQIQPNATTVQQTLNNCFSLLLKQEIDMLGCGRTDTGVHASMFVAHFDVEQEIQDTEKLLIKANKFLPKDIAIYKIEKTSNDFNARFSAKSRTYRYLVHTKKDPFLNKISWFYPYPLDINIMNEACKTLKKYKDFSCFAKSGGQTATNLCDIYSAQWQLFDNYKYTFTISANRFLRNMVRAITGTMIELGTHKIDLVGFENIINSKNRSNAGASVPAQALTLIDVEY